MVQRCSICDYTHRNQSEFYDSVCYHSDKLRKLLYDKKTSSYICSDCYGEVLDTYMEYDEIDVIVTDTPPEGVTP
jgi:hypothetical protein